MTEKRSDSVLDEGRISKKYSKELPNSLLLATNTSSPKKIKSDALTTISIPQTCESVECKASSSSLSENSVEFDSELSHLESYEIIWFNCDTENPVKLNRLRKISDYIKFFDNVDLCRHYIEMITIASDKNVIFLVASGHLADELILPVHHLNHIRSIHCLTL